MKQNNAVSFIGNALAGLIFLGLALYAQTPHTQNAFLELGHDKVSGYAQFNSWGYAIALELAVLYFTVRGKFQASYIFAFVSVSMNVAYYTIHDNNMLDFSQNWPRWLISVSLPLAIAYYSHCIVDAESVDVFAGLKTKVQSWYARLTPKQEIVQETIMQTPVQEEPVQTITEEPVQSDLSLQISALRANQIPDEEIATKHLRKVPGLHIAPLLQVNASTVSRWRKASNGFHKEPA